MLHDEAYRRAAFAATETFADVSGLVDRERWRAFVVERTQAFVVGSAAAQFHKVAYHIDNVGGIEDSLNGFLIYSAHSSCKVKNFLAYTLPCCSFAGNSITQKKISPMSERNLYGKGKIAVMLAARRLFLRFQLLGLRQFLFP